MLESGLTLGELIRDRVVRKHLVAKKIALPSNPIKVPKVKGGHRTRKDRPPPGTTG